MSSHPAPARKPGGARPNPSSLGPTPNSTPPPPVQNATLPPSISTAGQASRDESQTIRPTLPALALKPRLSSSPSPSPKPKLSIVSPFPLTPSSLSSVQTPPSVTASPYSAVSSNSIPATRHPVLLHAPSASNTPSRKATPLLKLAMPSAPSASSGFSSGHGYPSDSDEGDALHSALKTPIAGEDRNPTVMARQYDEGESSYGYGRVGGGLENGDSSDLSAMTQALRQAVARSRYENSPHPSSRSRASSRASQASRTQCDPDLSLDNLSISSPLAPGVEGKRGSLDSLSLSRENSDIGRSFDPNSLVLIRRLGEGSGGGVDLVEDEWTGRVMAKKVSSLTDFTLSNYFSC